MIRWRTIGAASAVGALFVAGLLAGAAWVPGESKPPTGRPATSRETRPSLSEAVPVARERPPQPVTVVFVASPLADDRGSQRNGREPRKAATDRFVSLPDPETTTVALDPDASPPAGGTYGTSVEFVNSPTEAVRQCLQQQKLLFLLHVAGNFEEAKFT